LATSELSRLVEAVNYVKQYNTDHTSEKANLQRAFNDVTAILMELKQFDMKAFEFEVMQTSSEVESYIEKIVDHVIPMNATSDIQEIEKELVTKVKPYVYKLVNQLNDRVAKIMIQLQINDNGNLYCQEDRNFIENLNEKYSYVTKGVNKNCECV